MNRFGFIIRKLISNIGKRLLASLGSVLSLLLLLLLFDLAWISSNTVGNYYEGLISDIDIELFLDDSIPDSTIEVVKYIIADLDGVDSIIYISRENAREQLLDLMGIDLLKGLEVNPLPRSITVVFKENYLNSENLNSFSGNLRRLEGVNDIFYPSQQLEQAEYACLLISEILMVLGILIALAAILNSIHGTVLSARTQTEELVQLRFLGASQIFLAIPYILESTIFAMVAVVAGWAVIFYSIDLVTFKNIEVILPMSLDIIYFCMIASVIGMFGGYFGIRRVL